MTQEPKSVSVTAVDPDDKYATLEVLLTEYHTWLIAAAREWAAEREPATGAERDTMEHALPDEEEYDPATAASEDVATLSDPDASASGFLAFHEESVGGVILLYGVSAAMAEIKRLYVRPESRGNSLGRALCRATIDAASEEGYERVGLTTPPWSKGAHALYEDLAFEYTDPYPETKLPKHLHEEALFMQRSLTS